MNEMIGKKQPSPEAAVCSITNLADGKKVSLHRAHTTCDSIYVVDNRIKADVHRTHVDRRGGGDGVFAVMSLGNWTAQ